MLNKIVNKRNIITIFLGGVLLVLWILSLIFGKGDDKVLVLVLNPIMPIVIYAFFRLMFKIVRKNASVKVLNFFVWFFLIIGSLGIVMMIVEFISVFPDGLSPTLGACMGLIVAALAEAKKNIENIEEK